MNEGALLTVAAAGVLSNDVAGADGFTAGGGVVGVRAAGGDTTTDVTTGVNTSIAGLHGTLILQANGSYTYQSTANNITANTTDVFVYTVKDGDGDLSTTTLTINLANATVVAPADNDVTVNEDALDTTITGSDLAAGTMTGSLGTTSALETDATNQLNGSGGFGTLTYALVSGGNAPTAGTFGTIQVNAERQLHLHADHAVRHDAGRQQRHQHGGGGELHLPGDRRQRQHRHRHDHGQHRRRRSAAHRSDIAGRVERSGDFGNSFSRFR